MELNKQDYLKKALLDTQERIRDFMNYSHHANDAKVSSFFNEYAKYEGLQAQKMQELIRECSQTY